MFEKAGTKGKLEDTFSGLWQPIPLLPHSVNIYVECNYKTHNENTKTNKQKNTFCQDIKYSTEQEAQNSKMLSLSDRDVNVAIINMIQCLVAKVNIYGGHFQ